MISHSRNWYLQKKERERKRFGPRIPIIAWAFPVYYYWLRPRSTSTLFSRVCSSSSFFSSKTLETLRLYPTTRISVTLLRAKITHIFLSSHENPLWRIFLVLRKIYPSIHTSCRWSLASLLVCLSTFPRKFSRSLVYIRFDGGQRLENPKSPSLPIQVVAAAFKALQGKEIGDFANSRADSRGPASLLLDSVIVTGVEVSLSYSERLFVLGGSNVSCTCLLAKSLL